MEIAIIGAGWYGCHLALQLKKEGHKVILYEKNPQIFSQISGSFGIRLHAGPHYPRSPETRKNCLQGLEEFKRRYPELVIPHEYSIYGLGAKDAEGRPPKVTEKEFVAVCKESESCTIVDPSLAGYTNLITAANIDEPSVALGPRLRDPFTKYLNDAGVEVVCNFDVQQIKNNESGVTVSGNNLEHHFDKVINTTSYQAFTPPLEDFPFNMETVYQPCLALKYEDKKPGTRPFSFIVMDGWFPCMMPVCDGGPIQQYIVTHGKWTIMGSYNNPAKAYNVLNQLNDAWIEQNIKPFCEKEMKRFWPEFAERFNYVGWKGTVLAKLKTRKEFRSAVTYEKDNIIHVIPGKISNIFDVEREVIALLAKQNVLEAKGYLYVRDGVLQLSCDEIEEKPVAGEGNTCTLQTFEELQNTASTKVTNKEAKPNPILLAKPPQISASFILSCLVELVDQAILAALILLSLACTHINNALTFCTREALRYSCHTLFSQGKNITQDQEEFPSVSVALTN